MLVNFFNSLLCDKEQCDFTISETLKEVHISITSNKLILNTNFDDILKSFIYKNDTLIDLTFKINENDPVYFYNKNDFFEEIKSSRFFNDSFNDSEEIVEKLDIRISKKIVNNILSIYNLDAFEDYLDNLSLDSILINLFKIPNF